MARLIAIDLGAYAVKVTALTGSGKDHDLEGSYTQRVPLDEDGFSSISARLASLDLLLREHPDWAGDSHLVEVVLTGAVLSKHRLQLPFDDPEQIEQTLGFLIEEEVPYDLEDYVYGWRKGAGHGEVHVVLAREDVVREVVEGLGERLLDPRAVHCDGAILARYATSDKVTAVIDVGHDHTTIAVATDGRVLGFASIDLGGRSATLAIQRTLSCSWAEAETLKHGEDDEDTLTQPVATVLDDDSTDPAFGVKLPATAREALNDVIGDLLAQVRAMLLRAEDTLAVEVDEVVLTGGGSQIPELRMLMQQDLGIEVRTAHDHEQMPVRPVLALADGLANRMADPDAPEAIDLRVGDLAYRGGMDVTRAVMTYGGAMLGFFLAAVVVLFAWQMRSLAQEQADVEARIAAVVSEADPELAEVISGQDSTFIMSMFSETVSAAQDEAEFLGDGNELPETVDLLYRITKSFPNHPTVKVDVDELDVSPAAIRIVGVTDGFAEIDAIADSLRTNPLFTDVEQEAGSQNRAGKRQFSITIDRTSPEGGDDTDVGEEG